MGSFFSDLLCFDYDVAIYDIDCNKLRFVYNVVRIKELEEILVFKPDVVLNTVTLKNTISAFDLVLPYLDKNCILSDIASVKTGLSEYYTKIGRPFVSTHPMFGPTFADLRNLNTQNAIIIKESCKKGSTLFRKIYTNINLKVFDYSFEEHDETMSYTLTIPFASTLVFGSTMKQLDVPGTTFKKHLDIAKGLLSEDDYLLSEILFNPNSSLQLQNMIKELSNLQKIVNNRDNEQMNLYLNDVRKRLGDVMVIDKSTNPGSNIF